MSNSGFPRSPSEAIEGKSESGLAEWTSKIKAMQRQVDADEEAEQTRLEQEIAASRLARKRRSQGLGYSGYGNLDVSRANVEHLDSISNEILRTNPKPVALQPSATANPSISAMHTTGHIGRSKPPTEVPSHNLAQPMSLAAFMGGSASGPRLRKHAPQQDAHDPTQFQQRSSDRAPHPAFGTGGVALPGLAVKRDEFVKPSVVVAAAKAKLSDTSRTPAYPKEDSNKSPTWRLDIRERTTSFPTASSSETRPRNTHMDPEVYKQAPVRKLDVRERTTSVPSASPSTSHNSTKRVIPVSHNLRNPSQLPASSTPAQDRTLPDRKAIAHPHESTPSDRPKTPRPSTEESSPPKSPYTAPPLAGPIRPQPRPSLSGPQISPSVTPSKAFTRPPPQKELTPSLSRLQGRGFVQNMVKVSAQFESPPAIIETPEKGNQASGRRASSVLDRWQPNVPAAPPSPSPAPRLAQRSVTFDPNDSPQPQPTDPSPKPLKTTASQPSLRQENIPPVTSFSSKMTVLEKGPPVGLGSATTLVVYKPTPAETPTLDEFGVRPSRGSKAAALDFPAPSTPLSHPTKERARKPPKRQGSGAQQNAANLSSPPQNVSPDLSNQSLVAPTSLQSNAQIMSRSTVMGSAHLDDSIHSEMNINEIEHRVPPYPPVKQVSMGTAAPRISHASDAPRLVRQALPGLAAQVERELPSGRSTGLAPTPDKGSLVSSSPQATKLIPQQPPFTDKKDDAITVSSPTKLSRIPITGNRPTVMDVAQALTQANKDAAFDEELSTTLPVPLQDTPSTRPVTITPLSGHADKRRSSYEKYSSIILPPLKEEATPMPTPTGSLSRKDTAHLFSDNPQKVTMPVSERSGILSLAISNIPPGNSHQIRKPSLPNVNFDSLINHGSRHVSRELRSTTISVEAMVLTGTTASPLSKDQTIFYDTEVLAIVHRYKSQLSGLVSTSVWGWEGKRAVLGPREQRKLQEIAQRYGTTVNIVQQNTEPLQLVDILGGVLAIRQGTRIHWTPENTAMHLVRSLCGVIFVDEKDLNIRNLCSGYSYCISILDSVYVWYGRGSTPLERKAALEYGRNLTAAIPPIELNEDGSNDDEMFWMILGDDAYANADHWKWRRTSSNVEPRIWRVKTENNINIVQVDFISNEASFHNSVYIFDCIWEFYVIVGLNARAHKDDIKIALCVASELSVRVSSARPFVPTVHVLVLPSQLPNDLRLMFRDLDELSMNQSEIPDHMNVLSAVEAHQHLETSTWDEYALRDQTLLPLGISA